MKQEHEKLAHKQGVWYEVLGGEDGFVCGSSKKKTRQNESWQKSDPYEKNVSSRLLASRQMNTHWLWDPNTPPICREQNKA